MWSGSMEVISQGRGSAKHEAAIFTLAFLALIHGTMAATYTVGGTEGWNTGVSYSAWAAKYTFEVGDTLKFNYNPEMHSVFQVSAANFKSCNLFPALNTYQTGSDSVTLTQPTTYYFVCGTPGHCSQGMALEITIGGSKEPSPSPAPAPAPKKSPAPVPAKHSPSPSLISPISPSSSAKAFPPSHAPGPSSLKSAAPSLQSGAPSVVLAIFLGGFLLVL